MTLSSSFINKSFFNSNKISLSNSIKIFINHSVVQKNNLIILSVEKELKKRKKWVHTLKDEILMLIQICYETWENYKMLLRKKFYENVKKKFNKQTHKNYRNVSQKIKKLVWNRKVHCYAVKIMSEVLEKVTSLIKTLNI